MSFKQMMSIPRLEERLACMITRRRFEMELEEIRPELSILRNAADEVRSSEKFRLVLKVRLLVLPGVIYSRTLF